MCGRLGVTGTDGPGMVNPRWGGLVAQVQLCVELNAWYLGKIYGAIFTEPKATSVPRWTDGGMSVDNLNELHEKVGEHECTSPSEYVDGESDFDRPAIARSN